MNYCSKCGKYIVGRNDNYIKLTKGPSGYIQEPLCNECNDKETKKSNQN